MVERQAWTPQDFWQMRWVTDMRLSPDGRHVAYTVESSDLEANEQRSSIWLLDVETGATRQFSGGIRRDHSPRWSLDGRQLAFISTRAGRAPQLWVMLLDGGEARQLTRLRRGVRDPFWSADGSWVGFRSDVRDGEPPLAAESTDRATREREERDEAERPRMVTRLQYRWDGKGYFEGRAHLFRVELATGSVEQLTDGDYDHGEAAYSPDGRFLAFVSDRSDERDANMTTDLWLQDVRTGETSRLTEGLHAVSHLSWSPDGSRLAFLAERKIARHSVYNTTLMVLELASGRLIDLFDGLDLSASVGTYNDIPGPALSAPAWSADGAALTVPCQRGGGVDVLRVPVGGGQVEPLARGEDCHIAQSALVSDGNRLLVLRCTPTRPWDIWEYAPGGEEAHPLTEVNGDLLVSRRVTAPERFAFPSFDGSQIEAWLYRPSMESDWPAPLVLWLHGGPHAAYGESFYVQAQILTGRGYAVLHVNPRGSTGYGEAFAQACDHDWGGGDYRDVMAAVDAALARGGLDGERMAVMGTSYGGYLTNWIVGQTDRFRAAVTINSVTNLFSSFGTGDIDTVWAEGDYGWPWEREEFYRERSPITYAAQVVTPIRIIAAENDYRCPISQSEEWYTWLKRLGRVPVDFVRLPRASHGTFASPRQRIQRMERVLEWIERWVPAR